MSLNVEILRSSFTLVVARNPQVVARFYDIFFERYPQVRSMFGVRNLKQTQEKMLTEALVAVIDNLEDAPWLGEQLGAIGARHVDYGVADEMYDWVGECLLAALSEVAAEAWTPEVEQAWIEAYAAIKSLCLAGASQARARLDAAE